MAKAMRDGADEVSFGDLLRFNGGGAASRRVEPETFEEHLAAFAASPLAEFGPCRCERCEVQS